MNISNYQKLDPKDLRSIRNRVEENVERQLMVMQTPFGYRRVVELFLPLTKAPFAAILYIHWYEPSSPDSNRSQFVDEAKEMARSGAACLLIETLWSDPDFFMKRTQTEDIQISIEELVNTRRAMDLLLSQPGVDAGRFAIVGHDFGGMYGVVAGSLDRRPTHYVVMAATPRFPDWYLYAPKLEGEPREEFIHQFSPHDPITHISKLFPSPVFFQFGLDDPHVPKDRAQEFFEAAKQPKEISWYESGHGLNTQATSDRKRWLKERLALPE